MFLHGELKMKLYIACLLLLVSQFSFASDLILANQVKLQSQYLNQERTLLIKLPDTYHDGDSAYPVLYVLHAQWDMLSTLSTLDLLEDSIPNFIVVGVEGKGIELRPNDGKETNFANYISKEVIPFINSNYRTAPYSILSGHSNSGRFVLDYWLNNTLSFSQYFAFSPSLEDGYIVRQASEKETASLKIKAPITITLANEGEHMQKPFKELKGLLEKISKTKFLTKSFPEQSHRTTKHPSMQFALESSFLNWEASYETKMAGLAALKVHYAALSKKYGFTVNIPIETLQRQTAHYAISDAFEKMKESIVFTIKQTPKGVSALFEIVDYLLNNDYETAGNAMKAEICKFSQGHNRCVR